MRIAVVVVRVSGRALQEFAKALANGFALAGHEADLLDARTEDGQMAGGLRLPGYDYLALVTEPASPFSARLPETLSRILASGGGLVGKRGSAFVRKSGFRSGATLANVMSAMEKEGIVVNWSELLSSPSQARAVGESIGR
ncbi:MAG: hypothetical protein FWD94_04760 [Treponema sp.]|nr:hypothetical protein [Treponema sp.]